MIVIIIILDSSSMIGKSKALLFVLNLEKKTLKQMKFELRFAIMEISSKQSKKLLCKKFKPYLNKYTKICITKQNKHVITTQSTLLTGPIL